jgi:hypothetical protein
MCSSASVAGGQFASSKGVHSLDNELVTDLGGVGDGDEMGEVSLEDNSDELALCV